MIVLDEQLLGRELDATLAQWYRGPVLFITDLRPGTVIKDVTPGAKKPCGPTSRFSLLAALALQEPTKDEGEHRLRPSSL